MKKIIILGIVSIFLLTSFNSIINAGEENTSDNIITAYSFETPVFSKVDINNTIYDSITIEGAPCIGNPGEPLLPGKGSYILLPPNSKVSNIVVNPGEMISLGSGYLVEPADEPVRLSEVDSAPLPVPDDKIYSSNELFPGTFYSEVGTYGCKGYTILVLQLHPVQYIPASGELFYYPDLMVNVETIEETRDNSLFRGTQEDNDDVSTMVDNPSMGNMYMEELQSETLQSTPSSPMNYDLLIITNNSLKSGFEPLKQAHNAEGLNTLICTVENIYSHFQGVDNAEKIRNFIKYTYTMYGIEYVLLGGDTDIIPARYFGVYDACDIVWDQIPSDLYYAGLDGRWTNSETPKPAHKDISINDPGVTGSGGLLMEGPELNSTDYVVGTDSMEWVVKKSNESGFGICKLTFNPPLDLSGERWLNFQAQYIGYNHCPFPAYSRIILQDTIGRKLKCHPPTFLCIEGSLFEWESFHFNIPKKNNFNYYAVKSISFHINFQFIPWPIYPQNEFFKLDGIYFSDWLDEVWGEPEEADLYAEVYVGRACVDNAIETNNFVSKTLAYMNTNTDEDLYLKKVLLAGELLAGDANDPLTNWGGDNLNQLIGICRKWGYKTIGIPRDKYTIDKLDDKDWEKYGWPKPAQCEGGWPKSEIINRINTNVHIINHDGHSYYNYNMKMDNSDVDALTNTDSCFIYSHGCMAGGFDNPEGYDCIAEHFTVKTNHGAFAGIWNSRYGWFIRYITDGAGQRFNREFWDAVFGENIKVIGKANQDSKEDNIWRINNNDMRYTYYELNLFGDPSIQLKLVDSGNNQNQPNSQSNNQPSSQSSTQSGSTSQQSTTTTSSTSTRK